MNSGRPEREGETKDLWLMEFVVSDSVGAIGLFVVVVVVDVIDSSD